MRQEFYESSCNFLLYIRQNKHRVNEDRMDIEISSDR